VFFAAGFLIARKFALGKPEDQVILAKDAARPWEAPPGANEVSKDELNCLLEIVTPEY
jgi:hypothetical protein